MDQCVGKFGARCVDLTKLGENIVNNLDLIHWIIDQLLAILVINR
ncbi:conserved hypothetical protein [Vibrio harveyi]|uniref:Uncharacterized protein n=1 Tax=Vibrio harveyi TaxID=669 RepID=A0A8B3DIC2_VIBHA|nr:hypothetical protein CU052_05925 [Vibrio harveyi]PNM41926.1 hypothetical protein AL469_017940 [Vibrio harveyi]PNM52938.1 hypothetical protein AL540_012080 [Vibrio harveyi]QFQ79001.1 hypothetical protein F9277_17040 [Vibrio harveyi]RIW12065.1 hypothetical protein DS957_013470 [Vibrio harveyi]